MNIYVMMGQYSASSYEFIPIYVVVFLFGLILIWRCWKSYKDKTNSNKYEMITMTDTSEVNGTGRDNLSEPSRPRNTRDRFPQKSRPTSDSPTLIPTLQGTQDSY
eukprot:NODE_7303_length_792_cov_25.312407_g6694_i0.p1 GENE.NODE_7303_length_792_cov_25.312407_g6694_i0~~NODE_7303_length_792_cov_25.312407_g6694_i0.p1  ORF type:complete len:105 (+),score=3.18 NODE_7303_length_792_cov_25.312407_g6694_i0:73-387(+)